MTCGECSYLDTNKCPYLRPEKNTNASLCGFFITQLTDLDKLELKQRESKAA